MVLRDEYHRADHANCRATAGVTLQGRGFRGACPVERGRSRVCGPRPLPAQCSGDVFAARTDLSASARPCDRMEVRHACRSSGATGQPHDDGRPQNHRREGHPRGRRLRITDRRLHRAHVRPGGGVGYRSRSPEPHCVRNCHDDSIGIAVCGCGGAACGRVAGGRRCARSPRVGEARHPSQAGAFACRHDGDIASDSGSGSRVGSGDTGGSARTAPLRGRDDQSGHRSRGCSPGFGPVRRQCRQRR